MGGKCFNVYDSKKGFFIRVIFLAFMYLLTYTKEGAIVIWGILIIASVALYKNIKVTGNDIKVKNALYKKYSFSCIEIEEIQFYGATTKKKKFVSSMIIVSKNRKTGLNYRMIGYGEMARYLLEQREAGIIKESVFTPSVVQGLKICAETEFNESNNKDE